MLRILQVSTSDSGGGAEKVAWNLLCAYRKRGFPSRLAVGYKHTDDPDVLLIPNNGYRSGWERFWLALGNILTPLVGRVRGAGKLRSWLHLVGRPPRWLEIQRGREDFDFPGTWRILELPAERSDILHCHNLHGGYFDLRALPWLSRQIPTILTLHDAWLLSGHCAHSFDCERWKTGCGQCPNLSIYPAIRRDGTAYNWRRKRDIYVKSRLYIATPSRWLMRKVEQSILAPAIQDARIIPNGIDLSVFQPADDKQLIRDILRLPRNAKILLFVANRGRKSPWRDFKMMQTTLSRVAVLMGGQPVVFIVLGDASATERIGMSTLQFISYQNDPKVVANYYQAADVYVHAARADTFPNVVLEALACGMPVVATAVGGIPEQIENGVTGFIVQPQDSEIMAKRIVDLLNNCELRRQMGIRAAEIAQKRYDLNRQADEYLAWYNEILERNFYYSALGYTK